MFHSIESDWRCNFIALLRRCFGYPYLRSSKCIRNEHQQRPCRLKILNYTKQILDDRHGPKVGKHDRLIRQSHYQLKIRIIQKGLLDSCYWNELVAKAHDSSYIKIPISHPWIYLTKGIDGDSRAGYQFVQFGDCVLWRLVPSHRVTVSEQHLFSTVQGGTSMKSSPQFFWPHCLDLQRVKRPSRIVCGGGVALMAWGARLKRYLSNAHINGDFFRKALPPVFVIKD